MSNEGAVFTGGNFTNQGGNTITGTAYGVELNGAGSVLNLGAIYATLGSGLIVGGAGYVTNAVRAVLTGSSEGVFIDGAGHLYNTGTLTGGAEGAMITGVGHVYNYANAVFSGGTIGLDITAAGNVTNAGSIGGGILISGAGLVTNLAAGSITGGVDMVAAGTVQNSGVISAAGIGVVIGAAGLAVNLAGGTISGGLYGVDMAGTATVQNAGELDGASGTLGGALVFQQAAGILLVDPGAVFNGNVSDAGLGGMIGLDAGTVAGVLDMGASFSGFSGIQFATGSEWTLMGGQADLAGTEAIGGFVLGDTIDLEGFSFSSDTYVAGVGLELSGVAGVETLALSGAFATSDFVVSNVAGDMTQVVLCYLAGTMLLTPRGEVAIETLAIGDVLVTRFGGLRAIKWIGRQSFASRFLKTNRDMIPVRIAAGALGEDLPRRALWVSPGHSMLVGDVLVLARNLVNGVTVTQSEMPDVVAYYQVEFETHDCVLAEGTWSESFGDGPDLRSQFQNAASFDALYPAYLMPEALALCAARPERGLALEMALRPVVARAAVAAGSLRGWIDSMASKRKIQGWAQDEANPDMPVLLEIWLGETRLGDILACDHREDLAAAGMGSGRCAFTFITPAMLTEAEKGRIHVRRAVDGVELMRTPDCERVAA
jgi:hypothetical protein